MIFLVQLSPTVVLLQLLTTPISAVAVISNTTTMTTYSYPPFTTTPKYIYEDSNLNNSRNLSVPLNNKIFSYTIYPSLLAVKVGDSYALTCQTDSIEGLEALKWMLRTNRGYRTLDCDQENEGGFKCDISEFPLGTFSVLDVTTFERSGPHSSVEYNFVCAAKPALQASRNQEFPEGNAVVTVYPPHHDVETGLEVVGGTVLVLVVLVAVWVLVRKGKFRSAFAGIHGDL